MTVTPPLRRGEVELDCTELAEANRRLAEREEHEAIYHSDMAVCLSDVGDEQSARAERNRATILRRAAQIKRDLALKYDRRSADG